MSDRRQGMFHHCLGALKLKFQFTKFQLLSLETETINDDPVFPFNSFKAKVPECCCALCTGVLDPMHIATSARPDLLHCVAWRLHPQIASHQVYGNTRQNKIQSSLGCLCRDSGHACAMSACRESPGWELADSIMFPICFFGTACSFRIFPEPQELTHVLICT